MSLGRHLLRWFMVSIGVLLLSGVAVADWVPSDGHKMHYPQMPDEDGWDVSAAWPGGGQCLADDWECSETGYVTDIHFWGSWHGGEVGNLTGL